MCIEQPLIDIFCQLVELPHEPVYSAVILNIVEEVVQLICALFKEEFDGEGRLHLPVFLPI